MGDVAGTFHLATVTSDPVDLLKEVFAATVGTNKLTKDKIEPFVVRLRDAFDLFTMVNPEKVESSKPVTTDDVKALEVQIGIMNYPWPSGAQESWARECPDSTKAVPFTQFLRWAFGSNLSLYTRTSAAKAPKYPLQSGGSDSKFRDILYAQFDVEQSNKLCYADVSGQSVRYLAVDQYSGWEGHVRSAFDKVSKTDGTNEVKFIDRQEFRKYLTALNDNIGATFATPHAEAKRPSITSTLPLDWKGLTARFPFERSPEQLKQRDVMYASFDDNNSGKMSLAEAQAGCTKTYGDIPQIVTTAAVRRAFITSAGADDNGGDNQTVERNEFRVFIANLHDYCQLRSFLDGAAIHGDPKATDVASMRPFWQYHNDDADACTAQVTALANGPTIPFESLATWWLRRRRSKDVRRSVVA